MSLRRKLRRLFRREAPDYCECQKCGLKQQGYRFVAETLGIDPHECKDCKGRLVYKDYPPELVRAGYR